VALTKEELSIILQEGEGYRTEFKERLTANLDREMVAFANASGGRLFLGISDDGKISGIEIDNKLKSQVQDIANNCDPAIKIQLEAYKNILVINVREGADKPYRCTSGFYTRTGPNSQKLSRDQIVNFIQAEGKIRYDELIKRNFTSQDIDSDKLKRFLELSHISSVLDKPLLYKNLGIGEIQEGKVLFNNLAVLFFAKNLNEIYYHTVVTCALYKGKEKATVLDRKDYNIDLISNVDLAMNFLKQYLPLRYEFTGELARKEIPELPYEALREALINAVVHRDYFEKGANVMMEIFDDRIEITNPGGLVKGLTPENFGKVSMLRNPGIANLLQRIDYIEKMGTGIERIRLALKTAKVAPVQYEFNPVYVKAVFPRPKIGMSKTQRRKRVVKVGEKVGEKLSANQKMILENIKKEPLISAKELAVLVGISPRKIEENIAKLKLKGVLERLGPDKGGHWEIIHKEKDDD